MEQILEENHSPTAKRKKMIQLTQGIQVNHSILYTREGAEKTGFPRFSPAPCYILVGIN
jgi:hypothetical protein